MLYYTPKNAIIHDEDGSLTGLYKGWATGFTQFTNQTAGCSESEINDGLICDSSAALRRISFHQYQPGSLYGLEMNIVLNPGFNRAEEELADDENWGTVVWQRYNRP